MSVVLLGIGIIAIVVGIVVSFWGYSQMFRLRDEVNERIPSAERFGSLFIQLRYGEILAKHYSLFPGSGRPRNVETAQYTGIALILIGWFVVLFAISRIGHATI